MCVGAHLLVDEPERMDMTGDVSKYGEQNVNDKVT